MELYIIIAPLLGYFFATFIAQYMKNKVGKASIALFAILSSSAVAVYTFFDLNSVASFDNIKELLLFSWIRIDVLDVYWALSFNNLTTSMLVVVTLISSTVFLFSTEYMSEDPHLIRYMSYLCLFVFCMMVLVTANNLLQMFVGWEGVGVSSFLLINFWYTRIQANKAAIKAMLVNRIGDFFILLAMFVLYSVFDTLDYNVLSAVAWYVNPTILFAGFNLNAEEVICFFILFGAMGKSAQLGLHTWLPDAMEGPTPVSALIHAATMVTAGVFLIIRTSFLFEYAPMALDAVVIIGSTTAFFAASIALFQNDIKKVVAYSTCSQLGYMLFICGLGGYDVGFFHLTNHAYFKAVLFLASASVIHAMADEQDMRKMGGLKNLLPFTYAVFLFASLALAGFPYLAGFYSKDIILEIAFAKYNNVGLYAFTMGLMGAACTAYYSTRLLYLVFLDNPNGNKKTTLHAHEGGLFMVLPMLFLVLCSITTGYFLKDMFIGIGTDFWKNAIVVHPSNYTAVDIEFIPGIIKLLPLFFTLFGVILAVVVYSFLRKPFYDLKLTESFRKLYSFFHKKWYIDRMYNELIASPLIKGGYTFYYQVIDRGFIERLSALSITHIVTWFKHKIIKSK